MNITEKAATADTFSKQERTQFYIQAQANAPAKKDFMNTGFLSQTNPNRAY
jgi:hypothetical protein